MAVNNSTQKSDELGRWDIGKIFWGLLLVLLGGLALASNFGLVEVHFSNIWRLWPLLIIAAGLSVLSLRHLIWRIVVVVFAVLTLGAIVWVMVSDYPSARLLKSYDATVPVDSSSVKQAAVSIKAGASSVKIGTANQKVIAQLKLETNIAKIHKSSIVVGDTQKVSLSMDINDSKLPTGEMRSSWGIDLMRGLPLSLDVEAGASDIDIDMSEAQLKSIIVRTGAANMVVKLGSLEDRVDVAVESGVSAVTIRVPKNAGVRLSLKNGLTANHLSNLKKVDDNIYESPEYNQASKKIDINSKIGVSSFTIERY